MAKQQKTSSIESIISSYSAEKESAIISTGIYGIDQLFGGGIAEGSMYAFWGEQGSGKSTIAFQIMKRMCKIGKKCVFIDVEKAFNSEQQEAFGLREYVESRDILHLTVDNYEQLVEVGKAVAAEGGYSLVVCDSETQLLPKLPEDTVISDAQPGQKARQSSTALTVLKSVFFKEGITSIFLFHARANINMSAGPYAPASKQAGGFAAKHIPDVILHIQPGQKLKDDVLGQIIHLECDKNKFAKPFTKIDRKLFFGKGIVKKVEIVDMAIEKGLIVQSGSFFKLPDGETIRGTAQLYDLPNEKLVSLKKLIEE